jgi:linearmycin/streptolysin S transport system permease protein
MIGPVIRVSWLALVRDRYALVLSFLVPVAFFSILAFVFGGVGREGLPAVRVAVIDEDHTGMSALLVKAIENESSLAVERHPLDATASAGGEARRLVQRGDVPVAVVVPAGFGERFARFPAETLTVELYSDRAADPVAHHVVAGLLQRALIVAAPERLVRGVTQWLEDKGGTLAPAQRELLDGVARSAAAPSAESGAPVASPFRVAVTDVQAERGREGRNVVSYYAAGIGVMFLLFTMTTATRGLIAEEETGTLERLLSTDLTMGRLLLGRWLFAVGLGCAQLAVMFSWGWMAFGVDLFGRGHLAGVSVMTLAAAAAAATFGLVLGTACRSQAQLQGLATVVILLMSALGGSMVPRYLMPEAMRTLGLVTFNAWAVTGYEKVFWRDAPLAALWPQVAVLTGMTVVGLFVARRLARRWESV